MDLLSGVVLLDGRPPRSLPADVRSHPLYARVFGAAQDFDVAAADGGAQRTTHPLGGLHYEFRLQQPGGALAVAELDGDDQLELLDPEGALWAADLPPRLVRLHSHWLSRSRGALLFRDPRVPGRAVSFVALARTPSLGGGGGGSLGGGASVARVPPHARAHGWRELVASAAKGEHPTLVVFPLPPVSALAKLEPAALIHSWLDRAGGRFLFELPRLGLEFELRGGDGRRVVGGEGGEPGCSAVSYYTTAPVLFRLCSVDFANFALAPEQQLADTLPGFTQYLVLAPLPELLHQPPWDASTKLLAPAGAVERGPTGAVAVAVPGETDPGASVGWLR